MSKTIRYYFSPPSPFAYMGHERLCAIAEKHGAIIEPRPISMQPVYPASGGLPMGKRAPQRLAYRLLELKRWSQFLGLPMNIEPKYFPVSDTDAALMICAAMKMGDYKSSLTFIGAVFRAVWEDELNIADEATLIHLADSCGLDGKALRQAHPTMLPIHEAYTQEAIDAQVFGAPWYIYKEEPFWGQDRLDFLDRALAES